MNAAEVTATTTRSGVDPATRAELDALRARLDEARTHKIGFPDATDFDYTDLAPFFSRFLLNNLGDPDVDGGYAFHTKPMEREVVATIADLLQAPADNRWGYVTSGATEGTEYALWQARRRYPDAMVYTSAAAHHSVAAVIDRLDLPSICIRTDPHGEIDYTDLADQVDRHRAWPAIVVANIGTAMTEAIDDIRHIRTILNDLAVRRRWIHADAALSGLPLALLDPGERPGLDFADGADSMIVSSHKFVGSPVPAGVLVVRDSLREHGRQATYTGAPDTTVTNSRSGLAALVLWYALRRHGIDGLRERAAAARDLATYTQRQLEQIGWVDVHRHPHAFTVTLASPPTAITAKWSLTSKDGRSHIMCMPGVSREQIDDFVREIGVPPEADPPIAIVDSRRSGRILRQRLSTNHADAHAAT